MDKFWDFVKKNWVAVVGCVIAVLFSVACVPLLINWAFTVPALCDFFAVGWEAKDALAYYGSALGFMGTVIFSGLALWQNHVIKTEVTSTQIFWNVWKIKRICRSCISVQVAWEESVDSWGCILKISLITLPQKSNCLK